MNASEWWAFTTGVAGMALVAQLAPGPWTVPALGATAAVVSIALLVRARWSRRG